jgi:acyl-CoA dehydrogenase
MPFFQEPPQLGNTFDADALLAEYLARTLPPSALAAVEAEAREAGEIAGGRLADRQRAERLLEPRLVAWDAWGRRPDAIELTPLWREAKEVACRFGLVACAYEAALGPLARVRQMALVHVLEPSIDVYACPLAMSDGAARTLLDAGNAELVSRAVPRLTSRDPAAAWTSGQWMTERIGGSDVGLAETVARRGPDGWRLSGTKWFASAIHSEMALAIARPEGNGPGGKGTALFYLEARNADGTPNGILVNRLKEKLGTRKLPTAEITLDGARATPVAGLDGGVKAMVPMLNVTRTWNSVAAVAGMARALQLARDYARRRVAFGAPLARLPLHVDTLAGLEAEREGAFLLAFRAVELLGAREAAAATGAERALLRVVVPLAKLTTAKQAIAIASEALEAFGGAGYVEDTDLPRLLRDAQVLPVWEGTTNVLALEVLRALDVEGAPEAYRGEVHRLLGAAKDPALRAVAEIAHEALDEALGFAASDRRDRPVHEAGARRLALTLGRTLELALLVAHAQWALDAGRGPRALAAARRLARHGVDLLEQGGDLDDSALLVERA